MITENEFNTAMQFIAHKITLEDYWNLLSNFYSKKLIKEENENNNA